jgi:hypothetical protein
LSTQGDPSNPYQTAPAPVNPTKKSKALPIGIVIAILILAITARAIYVNHQHRVFYNSLLTRQTEIKQENFDTACANRDSCVGRFIVWDGIVDGNPPQGSNSLTVVSANGHAQINLIDPLPMNLHDGDKITFDGFLREVNTLSPDIVNTGYVRKLDATAAEVAKQKQEVDGKEQAVQAQQAAITAQSQQACKDAVVAEMASVQGSANFAEWTQTEAASELGEVLYSMPSTEEKEPNSLKLAQQLLAAQKQQLIASGDTEDGLQAGVDKFKDYYTAEMSRLAPGSDDVFRVIATPIGNFLKNHSDAIEPVIRACQATDPSSAASQQ